MSTDFYSHPVRTLSNGHLRVDVLAQAGPRVVRLIPSWLDANLLAETPDLGWETPAGWSPLWGGHRLWHAPEAFPRTYLPDGDGLAIDELADGIRLRGAPSPAAGLQKVMEVRLDPDRPTLTLHHSLHNHGLWPVTLAPWAITQMALGGVAILPQQAPVPSPYLPHRHLALWPYTRLRDPRLRLDDDLVLVHGQAHEQPFKIGYFNHAGWMAYLWGEALFVKRFTPLPGRPHPDLESNCEVYVWNRFLELETLGPLVALEPGAVAEHIETWEVHRVPGAEPTVDGIRGLTRSLDLA
ncbi:MAG: DUF4380 domain-containing protein [Caldilineales bacterium]|nr:DUF4380 domain-containing protein [Caldilineales bacterium]MDW8316381.1 hypothetical protein [Anaerolineae bacterium]